MSRIRGKNTKIELLVRRELHRRGFRFRLHAKGLPGTPDIVLPKRYAVVFVNGCFWHAHGCSHSTLPATNESFWKDKLNATIQRDQRAREDLLAAGWRVATVWECTLRNLPETAVTSVGDALETFLVDSCETQLEIGPARRDFLYEG